MLKVLKQDWVEQVFSKYKALGSIPSTKRKRKKRHYNAQVSHHMESRRQVCLPTSGALRIVSKAPLKKKGNKRQVTILSLS
jgi:hypothetical protein